MGPIYWSDGDADEIHHAQFKSPAEYPLVGETGYLFTSMSSRDSIFRRT
jgi:hypothetical protein